MNSIRRSSSIALQACQRGAWRQLGRFVDPNTQSGWNTLKQQDGIANQLIQDVSEKQEKDIDWQHWEKEIGHKGLVKCLKQFYEQERSKIDALKAQEGNIEKICNHGWEMYDAAVEKTQQQVKQSEGVLSSGAQALWISHHNPPVHSVDTNEWVDSDLYMQAFIEKHHGYSPYQPGVENPESEAQKDAVKASWHTRMSKFNDRSDTPMLYVNMEQLPSWEYYDIHRRALLEHMIYFMIRKGSDYRQFPEVPPWKWLGDIEDHRYRYLFVAHKRRFDAQLAGLERERPLDLLPLDVDHYGEDHSFKLLQAEAEWSTHLVSRLMGNYMFLCDPFIPAQSHSAASHIMSSVDGGTGKWFKLGEDVNALFYLPSNHAEASTSPQDSFKSFMNYVASSGKTLNPSYAMLWESFSDILSNRGQNWFGGKDESASQAFLRRLRTDDPHLPVYTAYFEEMYSKFLNQAQEVTKESFESEMNRVQERYKVECNAYTYTVQSHSPALMARAKTGAELIQKLDESLKLIPLIESQEIIVPGISDPQAAAKALLESTIGMDTLRDTFMEQVKAVKTSVKC